MPYNNKASRDRREALPTPKPGGSVWPRQSCPEFTARKEHLEIGGSQCWFLPLCGFSPDLSGSAGGGERLLCRFEA